jgi:quercetin dioxygenase-like cupin family protein
MKISDTKPEEITSNVLSGKVTRQSIISERNDDLNIAVVSFSKGATREFNSHTFDQVLYVTEGNGIIATETEEAIVTPGTFVFIPAGEKHRHGATKNSTFSHITIKST